MSRRGGRVAAVAALGLISVPLVLVAILSGSGGGGGLRVERSAEGLTAYVEDREQNVPGTADGRRSVRLECLDAAGRVVVAARKRWPFTDTDGGRLAPHVHQALLPDRLTRVSRCRLAGTKGPLEGPLASP